MDCTLKKGTFQIDDLLSSHIGLFHFFFHTGGGRIPPGEFSTKIPHKNEFKISSRRFAQNEKKILFSHNFRIVSIIKCRISSGISSFS